MSDRCLACKVNPRPLDALHCEACRNGQGTIAQERKSDGATQKPTRAEADEQQAGLAWLQIHGWHTWRIGQRDARGTQDPGVPDVLAIHPEHGLLWWEAKGKGGRQSQEQRTFEAVCRQAGVRYVCGGAAAMEAVAEAITEEREGYRAPGR